MDKQKITIIALSVVLFVASQYILFEILVEREQEKTLQDFQEGYEEGLTDAATTIFAQTENCQTAIITINNFTKQFLDLSCLQSESETSP